MYPLSCPYLVDAVLLPPEERLREHLPRLLHVELPGPQEAQEHRVRGNLIKNINNVCYKIHFLYLMLGL